jgi:GNAT superfamily N-acetyltransferase
MDTKIVLTDSQNEDFIKLIGLLDEDLDGRYGELQKKYKQHNKIDFIKDVVVIYKNCEPVACGAFKEFEGNSVEMKRVFVKKENRRQGLSKLVMGKLEETAKSKGYECAVLETGQKQYEAISLYKNLGYEIIPNYGPYIGNTNSICMKKLLK